MIKKLELRTGDDVADTLPLDPELRVIISADTRKHDTTTFHFGIDKRSICGKVAETRATEVGLADALNEPRRLCTYCAHQLTKPESTDSTVGVGSKGWVGVWLSGLRGGVVFCEASGRHRLVK